MAINFWEEQRKQKSRTFWTAVAFILMTIIAGVIAEWAMRYFAGEEYNDPIPFVAIGFMTVILIAAFYNYASYLHFGGSYVAHSMDCEQVYHDTPDPKERQLLNIVQELAIACSLPTPPVYIIPADEINAFAAGTSPENSIIAVTRGTLALLNRDELQGVLAHEFGHIKNGDGKISLRIAAMIMGFFVVSYLGLRLLQGSSYRRRSDNEKGPDPLFLAAIILIIVGAFAWFFGSILQSMISRQREFLADASAVQYTRNPYGIIGALKKIRSSKESDMPLNGKAYAHLYFNEHPSIWQRIFASHPPLDDRIAILEAEKGNFK